MKEVVRKIFEWVSSVLVTLLVVNVAFEARTVVTVTIKGYFEMKSFLLPPVIFLTPMTDISGKILISGSLNGQVVSVSSCICMNKATRFN